MTKADPATFAAAWIRDWNAHDLEAILSHYAPNVAFHSPKVAHYTKDDVKAFSSREQLRPYFARAFEVRPNLRFDLADVCQDQTGIALVYVNELGHKAVELMELNEERQVRYVRVLYDRII